MADPLSITASILAVNGALGQTAKLIRKIVNAPRELMQLANEIADMQMVLETLQAHIQELAKTYTEQTLCARLEGLVNRMQGLAQDIDTLLHKSCRDLGDLGGRSHRHTMFWIRQRGKIFRLKDSLREARLNILTALATHQSSKTVRIALEVQDVLLQQRQGQASLDHYYEQQSSRMSQGFAGMEDLKDILKALSESVGGIASVNAESPTLSSTQVDLRDLSAPALVDATSNWSDDPASSDNVTGGRQHRPFPSGDNTDTVLQVRASLLRPLSCPMHCSCQCHSISRLRTPRWLSKVFGLLFVGYSAVPVLSRISCNEKKCRKRSQPKFAVTYFFPLWLLNRMISIRANMSLEEPVGSMWIAKMPRIVPSDAAIAVKAFQTDVAAVQTLFSQGKASPYDVQANFGNSPLHYAVTYQSVELCKLLINNGADPFLCDNYFESPADVAWDMFFQNPASATALAIKDCFDETSVDNREFPLIHRIILGLEKTINLGSILQASTAAVNATDSKGRTALAWASFLGDAESAELLLAAGADPNIVEHWGLGALHLVAEAPNPSCLLPLLQSGALVDIAGRLSITPLLWACGSGQHEDDVRYVEPLVKAGADVNAVHNHMGRRPLHQAVLFNRTNLASYLIMSGAGLEYADNEGYTPLLGAVLYNSHACLNLLLEKGASVTARTERRRSLLHVAALTGDIETMNILSNNEAVVSRLNNDALDADHRTAQDLFNDHEVVVEEHLPLLGTAFRMLLRCTALKRLRTELELDENAVDTAFRDEDEAYFSAPESM